MSISYTNEPDTLRADDRPFVPAYARTAARKRGKVRTWMILAPIGAVVLGGAAVAMLMGGENTTPLVEPEAASAPLVAPLTPVAPPVAAPVVPAAPVEAAPVAVAPTRAVAAPSARRAAPASRPAARVTPTVAETTPATAALNAEPAGPRPYQPSSPTVVVTPTVPATPPTASIVIEP